MVLQKDDVFWQTVSWLYEAYAQNSLRLQDLRGKIRIWEVKYSMGGSGDVLDKTELFLAKRDGIDKVYIIRSKFAPVAYIDWNWNLIFSSTTFENVQVHAIFSPDQFWKFTPSLTMFLINIRTTGLSLQTFLQDFAIQCRSWRSWDILANLFWHQHWQIQIMNWLKGWKSLRQV